MNNRRQASGSAVPMNIRTFDSLLERIRDPDILRSGRELYLNDAVRLTKVQSDGLLANVLCARPFSVTLHRTGTQAEFRCSCAAGRNGCEHVAAVLFELKRRVGAHLDLAPDLTGPSQAREAAQRGPRRPKWAKSVARLLGTKADLPQKRIDHRGQWRLAFVLSVYGERRAISPLRIRIRKDGAEGQVSILQRVSAEDLKRLTRDERLLLDTMEPSVESYVDEENDGERWESDVELPYYERQSSRRSNFRWHDVMLLLEGKELYLETNESLKGKRLLIDSRPGTLAFSVSDAGGDLSFYPEIEWPDETLPVSDDVTVLSVNPLWVLIDNKVRVVGNVGGEDLIRMKQMTTPLIVPGKDRELFLARAFPALTRNFPLRSGGGHFSTVEGPPVPRLYLSESRGELTVRVRFAYGGTVETAGQPTSGSAPEIQFSGSSVFTVVREAAAEQAALVHLSESGLEPIEGAPSSFVYRPKTDPVAWLTDALPALAKEGFEVYGQEGLTRYRVRTGPSSIAFNVSSGIDWFDLTVDATFDGTPASLQAFIEAVREGRRYVRLTDGSYGMLSEELVRRFTAGALLGDNMQSALRFSRAQIALLDELSDGMEVAGDDAFTALRERLHSFSGIAHCPLPDDFHAVLRPYQQGGYDWLRFLHEFRFGGLLADDMGLGKTVQTLALLQYVHGNHDVRPSLIIVPTSLVHNWQREAGRFAPSLRVLTYHGLDRKRFRDSFEDYDIIIVSYGILRRDIEFLRDILFTYVILDESQNIKNFASVNARAARHLQSEHRLALTGTPVENNLTELWSQIHFLNPGLLGGLKTFTDHFVKLIERDRNEETASTLRRLIHPFLLRRTKELVAADLPPKFESVVLCDMDDLQRSAYHHWREYFRQAIMRSIETVGVRRSTVKVLEGLTKLRLVCCHPSLADERYRGTSGKFSAFEEMLDDILQEGHKVLVFSQFVRMLTILRHHFDRHNISYEYLDGRTLHRKVHVDRFQNDPEIRAFLISLRAGGTGLNLTAADYVIHYDPWWNPAVETQATDRTHRIGQTRQVFSYKLITRDTVEEKILELQEKKKSLVSSVITTEQSFLKSLTREDIEDLFSS